MVEWNDFKISWRQPIAILVNSSRNHHSNLVTLEIFKILSRNLFKRKIVFYPNLDDFALFENIDRKIVQKWK